MTQASIKLSDIAPIALRVGHIKEQLLTPCRCGRSNCTLGEHIWRATRAMTPSPLRSSNTDPGGGNRWETHDDDSVWPIPNDPTGEAAMNTTTDPDEWAEALEWLNQAADHFAVVFGKYRPDRRLHTVDPSAAEQWCTHHLTTIGKCEPRYRGDLCRVCYDFQLAHANKLPPADLLTAKHEGRRWTEQTIRDSLRAAYPKKPKGKKRKAS